MALRAIILFSVYTTITLAVNATNIDSLKKGLVQVKSKQLKANIIYSIGSYYLSENENMDSCLYCVNKSLELI